LKFNKRGCEPRFCSLITDLVPKQQLPNDFDEGMAAIDLPSPISY
jgi:hypothetical protein